MTVSRRISYLVKHPEYSFVGGKVRNQISVNSKEVRFLDVPKGAFHVGMGVHPSDIGLVMMVNRLDSVHHPMPFSKNQLHPGIVCKNSIDRDAFVKGEIQEGLSSDFIEIFHCVTEKFKYSKFVAGRSCISDILDFVYKRPDMCKRLLSALRIGEERVVMHVQYLFNWSFGNDLSDNVFDFPYWILDGRYEKLLGEDSFVNYSRTFLNIDSRYRLRKLNPIEFAMVVTALRLEGDHAWAVKLIINNSKKFLDDLIKHDNRSCPVLGKQLEEFFKKGDVISTSEAESLIGFYGSGVSDTIIDLVKRALTFIDDAILIHNAGLHLGTKKINLGGISIGKLLRESKYNHNRANYPSLSEISEMRIASKLSRTLLGIHPVPEPLRKYMLRSRDEVYRAGLEGKWCVSSRMVSDLESCEVRSSYFLRDGVLAQIDQGCRSLVMKLTECRGLNNTSTPESDKFAEEIRSIIEEWNDKNKEMHKAKSAKTTSDLPMLKSSDANMEENPYFNRFLSYPDKEKEEPEYDHFINISISQDKLFFTILSDFEVRVCRISRKDVSKIMKVLAKEKPYMVQAMSEALVAARIPDALGKEWFEKLVRRIFNVAGVVNANH